jgi:hypothetical protein
VNEASATSLAMALNIAASQALSINSLFDSGADVTIAHQNTAAAVLELNAGHGVLDWFQYAGNTYIVEAVNSTNAAAAHAGLASNDIVVELTGLVNVPDSVHVDLGGVG